MDRWAIYIKILLPELAKKEGYWTGDYTTLQINNVNVVCPILSLANHFKLKTYKTYNFALRGIECMVQKIDVTISTNIVRLSQI